MCQRQEVRMGMTIEENIEKYKNLSKREESDATSYAEHEFFATTLKHFTEAKFYRLSREECRANAAEYRQIAEWLEKYQKVEEIFKNWCYGADSCDCMKDIGKVILDENVN